MASNNTYYSGQGSLLVAERNVDGSPKGFRRIGNVPELTLNIEIDKFEHKESESGVRAIDLSIIKEKRGKFSFTLENISIENMALAFWGESATVTGSTVAAPGESFTVDKGLRYALAHPNISSVVVKDDNAGVPGTTTYTVGDDYTVDAEHGTITIVATGAIADSDVIWVTYTYGGYTRMDAFTQAAAPERFMRFEGLNTVDGSHVVIDLPRAQFDPGTGYQLINEELSSITLGGTLLLDSSITSGSQFFTQRNIAA